MNVNIRFRFSDIDERRKLTLPPATAIVLWPSSVSSASTHLHCLQKDYWAAAGRK